MKNFWLPEFDALAQYNAERSRGIMHTPEYIREMEILQKGTSPPPVRMPIVPLYAIITRLRNA
jgi:hypothetical protein